MWHTYVVMNGPWKMAIGEAENTSARARSKSCDTVASKMELQLELKDGKVR